MFEIWVFGRSERVVSTGLDAALTTFCTGLIISSGLGRGPSLDQSWSSAYAPDPAPPPPPQPGFCVLLMCNRLVLGLGFGLRESPQPSLPEYWWLVALAGRRPAVIDTDEKTPSPAHPRDSKPSWQTIIEIPIWLRNPKLELHVKPYVLRGKHG